MGSVQPPPLQTTTPAQPHCQPPDQAGRPSVATVAAEGAALQADAASPPPSYTPIPQEDVPGSRVSVPRSQGGTMAWAGGSTSSSQAPCAPPCHSEPNVKNLRHAPPPPALDTKAPAPAQSAPNTQAPAAASQPLKVAAAGVNDYLFDSELEHINLFSL